MQNLAFKVMRGGGAWGKRTSRIVIAHGLLGSSANWTTAARHLAEHELLRSKLHEVIMLDMRNHGDSPHASRHTNATMASDLEAFILQMQQKQQQTQLVEGEAEHDGAIVLIGHSMGGLAVMSALLRRANEAQLLLPSAAELQARCVRGDYYGWQDDQGNAQEMRSVNRTMGFPSNYLLFDTLYCAGGGGGGGTPSTPHTQVMGQKKTASRVVAAIIVDITPSVILDTQFKLPQSVSATLDAMAAVDLSRVHTIADGAAELERAGLREKAMRDFVLTNLRLNSQSGGATWRCNLPVIRADRKQTELGLRSWFLEAANRGSGPEIDGNLVAPTRCTVPTLFVFGEASPYNSAAERKLIHHFFSNATQVDVAGAGHFVHYEKVREFLAVVAPFLAAHL